MFTLELGVKVKDCITGFKGVIMGRVEYLTGCRQYLVVSKSEKNKPGDSLWLDEDRLAGASIKELGKAPGGPQSDEAPVK